MPKAILEYNLPEENEDFDLARKGAFLQGVIDDYDNYLRGRIKYEELSEEVDQALTDARGKLWELINGV